MWRVVPYKIFGVSLWSVETRNGHIEKYCSSREDAQSYCDNLNA